MRVLRGNESAGDGGSCGGSKVSWAAHHRNQNGLGAVPEGWLDLEDLVQGGLPVVCQVDSRFSRNR